MAQLVALMSGVVLGGVAEVVGSNLARGKIFTASIGSVDSLYPSIYIYIYIYIYKANSYKTVQCLFRDNKGLLIWASVSTAVVQWGIKRLHRCAHVRRIGTSRSFPITSL